MSRPQVVPVPELEEVLKRWARAAVRCEETAEAYYEQGMDAPYTVGSGDAITACAHQLQTLIHEHAHDPNEEG